MDTNAESGTAAHGDPHLDRDPQHSPIPHQPEASGGRAAVVRFRHHPGRTVAGATVTISMLTLVAASPWFAPLLLAPLLWTGRMWLAGTDADRHGLRVRALVGRRRVGWPAVETLATDRSGRVVARLVAGTELALPAVTPGDLPRLVAASGTRLTRRRFTPADAAH